MKRTTKLLSILLAAIMLLGMLPLGMLTASAAGETTIPAMPTAYPDGAVDNLQKIGLSPKLADFGEEITTSGNTARVSIVDGKAKVVSNDGYTSVYASGSTAGNFRSSAGNWRGASGLMFYLEVEDSEGNPDTTSTVKFNIQFSVENTARNGGTVTFAAAPCEYSDGTYRTGANADGKGPTKVGGNAEYYTYDATTSTWTKQVPGNTSYYLGTKGSRWYYIPFSSFYYVANGTNNASNSMVDEYWGTSLTEFAERYLSNVMGDIYNLRLRQGKGQTTVLYFNDIHMVYPTMEIASPNAATAEMLPGMAINGTPEGDAVASITDGVLTVSNTTNNNVSSVSNQRVWVRTSNTARVDITKAAGIRFHVDSRNLATGQQLLLRIRMIDNMQSEGIGSSYTLFTRGAFTTDSNTGAVTNYGTTDFVTLENANPETNNYSTVQFLLKTPASSVFVYDEDGDLVPCYGGADKLKGGAAGLSDYVLLPAGYVGDVYIPMDSFWAALSGSTNCKPMVSFDKAVELGLGNVWALGIIQGATGTMDANCEIKYSNFELVYDEIEATQTAVSMGNDLALRVKTETATGATIESAFYKLGDDTIAAKVVGNEIICDGILPQNAGEQITVTVNGKVNGKTVTNTVTTSVKDYCLKLIADTEASATAKNAAADLLRYANAAQLFAAGETTIEKPILDTVTQTAIDALGAGTNFETLTLTKESVKSATTAAGYDLTGAALRLQNALALKLLVATPADNTKAVTVSVTLGEKAPVALDVTDGACIFGGIGACDLATDLTVVLKVDGGDVQTLTYSMNDYFADALANSEIEANELTLVQALYDYCVSATAYADSLS